MRRTDRLFEIIQLFRVGKALRGQDIANTLEVSLRTVYRDIDTLIASGIPIEGERGIGYILREPIFLPPLALNAAELEALHFGMRIVTQTSDTELAKAAQKLLDKIGAVLPSSRQDQKSSHAISVYASEVVLPAFEHLAHLRRAVMDRRIAQIHYNSLRGAETTRRIWPLQVEYWGLVWTCPAWCELRNGFRVFRIDRITHCTIMNETFSTDHGRSYQDYLAQLVVDKPELKNVSVESSQARPGIG